MGVMPVFGMFDVLRSVPIVYCEGDLLLAAQGTPCDRLHKGAATPQVLERLRERYTIVWL